MVFGLKLRKLKNWSACKKLVLLVLLIPVLCLAEACSAPEVPINQKTDEKFVPPPDISRRPFVIAGEFLDNVKARKYKEAYATLGVDAKMRVNLKGFEEGMERYYSMASTKSVYVTRVVVDERVSGNSAIIKVADSKYPDAPPWIWEFEKTRAGWKIRSLDLPPLFIYKAKKSPQLN